MADSMEQIVVQGKAKGKAKAPAKRKKRKKWPIVLGVLICVVILLGVCVKKLGESVASQMGVVVTTTAATRGDLQESITTSGTVQSEDVKVIFAPVGGTLEEVKVTAGDAVTAGDILITYDMEEKEKQLQQAVLQLEKSVAGYDNALSQDKENQAKLSEATINLDVLNQQIEDNKSYLEDLQDQLSQSQRDTSNALAEEAFELQAKLNGLTMGSDEYNAVSAALSRNSYLQQMVSSSDYVVEMQQEIADVQERIAGYEEYKARMESQKTSSEATVMNSYDKIQYNADNELVNMNYKETEEDYYVAKQGITATFTGVITQCGAVEGSAVAEGLQLLTLESSEKLKVSFNASKYDIEKLALGQKAEVEISGRVYEGEVSKINRMATRNESNTPMVGVEIHLLNPDENIILGLDAKLTIYTKTVENAILVPVEVINADKEGDFLYVVENGVIVKKTIVCGITTDEYTEVKEGISENDVIVQTAYSNMEEGMIATVIPSIELE